MTDATLERDLRAILAARDPGPAPARLASDVRARLAAGEAMTGRWGAVPRLMSGFVAAAAVLVLVGFAIAFRPAIEGPGAAPAPDPTPPYVMQPGDGVVMGERIPLIQGLTALVAGGALLVFAVRTTHRRTRIAASLGILSIILVTLTIGTPDALAFTTGGYGVTPGRTPSDGRPGMYVAVTGNQPFTVVVTVSNVSRLPVDLLGLAAPAFASVGTDIELAHLPRFTAIANLPPNSYDGEAAEPFQRVTIEPGGSVNVAILGLAGTCALPAPGPEGQSGYELETVDLIYEQLTITHTQAFRLPEPVVITTTMPCTS